MTVTPPDPAGILAIALGASKWPDAGFARCGAFATSATRMLQYLRAESGFRLPAPNVLDLFDSPESASAVKEKIASFITERTAAGSEAGVPISDVLVYYVGHAGLERRDGTHFLAIRDTSKHDPVSSGLQISALAHTLHRVARGARLVFIVDACFSAAAVPKLKSSSVDAVRESAELHFGPSAALAQERTSLLYATHRGNPAIPHTVETHTMFTGALLHVLGTGAPGENKWLSVGRVAGLTQEYIRANFEDAVRPLFFFVRQPDGEIESVPLFPNPAAPGRSIQGGARQDFEQEDATTKSDPVGTVRSDSAEPEAALGARLYSAESDAAARSWQGSPFNRWGELRDGVLRSSYVAPLSLEHAPEAKAAYERGRGLEKKLAGEKLPVLRQIEWAAGADTATYEPATPLSRWLEDRVPDLADANATKAFLHDWVDLFGAIVESLRRLHAREDGAVFHCNLTPENVFLRYGGEQREVVFAGFDFAHEAETANDRPAPHPEEGTLRDILRSKYVPYEPLPDDAGHKVDAYSLAAVVYAAFSGRAPPARPNARDDVKLNSAVWRLGVTRRWEVNQLLATTYEAMGRSPERPTDEWNLKNIPAEPSILEPLAASPALWKRTLTWLRDKLFGRPIRWAREYQEVYAGNVLRAQRLEIMMRVLAVTVFFAPPLARALGGWKATVGDPSASLVAALLYLALIFVLSRCEAGDDPLTPGVPRVLHHVAHVAYLVGILHTSYSVFTASFWNCFDIPWAGVEYDEELCRRPDADADGEPDSTLGREPFVSVTLESIPASGTVSGSFAGKPLDFGCVPDESGRCSFALKRSQLAEESGTLTFVARSREGCEMAQLTTTGEEMLSQSSFTLTAIAVRKLILSTGQLAPNQRFRRECTNVVLSGQGAACIRSGACREDDKFGVSCATAAVEGHKATFWVPTDELALEVSQTKHGWQKVGPAEVSVARGTDDVSIELAGLCAMEQCPRSVRTKLKDIDRATRCRVVVQKNRAVKCGTETLNQKVDPPRKRLTPGGKLESYECYGYVGGE